jgi:very-short-patch-repair endonuclease
VAPDTLQYPVLDRRGNVLGYGDLAWTGARLIAEADGRFAHDSVPAAYPDRERANDFRGSGWTIVRFTWEDTRRPGYIVAVVRQALAVTA